MASGGMCTCLMSSGHTLSIGQHGLFLGGGCSGSLDRSTRLWLLSARGRPPTLGFMAFSPLLHSRGLPPRKLTSYFIDLHPKIKEIYISALNLNLLLKFKNISDIEPNNLAFGECKLLCPGNTRAWLALTAERGAVSPSSGAVGCALLLAPTSHCPSTQPPRGQIH